MAERRPGETEDSALSRMAIRGRTPPGRASVSLSEWAVPEDFFRRSEPMELLSLTGSPMRARDTLRSGSDQSSDSEAGQSASAFLTESSRTTRVVLQFVTGEINDPALFISDLGW